MTLETFAASVAGGVPDASWSRTDITQWLLGGLPYSNGAFDPRAFDAVRTSFRWIEISGATRFWGDDTALLTDAAAALAVGLCELGVPIAISAGWRAGHLALRFGTSGGSNLARVVQSTYPEIKLVASDGPGPALASTAVLSVRRNTDAESGVPGLLDRLGTLPGVDRQFEALLVPVARPMLDERLSRLTELHRRVAAERAAQTQVDHLTTRQVEDTEAVRLGEHIASVIDECVAMRDRGAFCVVTRVSASEPAALSAAAGAVVATTKASVRWRISAPDAPMPIGLVDAVAATDLLRLPARDVAGLPIRRAHALDEHTDPPSGGSSLRIGVGAHGTSVALPTAFLNRHVFCSGQTGSGKTSFLAALARQLDDQGVPVTVIEPVKDEYAGLSLENLRVWRPGAADPGQPWALNPLVVPRGVSVAQHADRVVALLRSSLGLPDPLPALLQIAVGRVYRDAGWDLAADANVFGSNAVPPWPDLATLRDAALELELIDGYDRQTRGTIRAALAARFEGLLTGPRARVLLGGTDLPIDEVLRAPLIVNLDAIGDPFVKAFIAHAFLIRLVEHRRAHPSPRLSHVTLIEEAHTLMPAAQPAAATGSADPVGAVAAALGDLLAEIRSTGEGLVIADQSPSRLDRSAIVNTATKVCLRTADRADQEVLAAAVGLEAAATAVFAGLANHEALVAWEGMDAPVRVSLAARHLVAGAAPHSTAPVFTLVPDETARLASFLLTVPEADAVLARRAITRSIRAAFPGVDDSIVRQVFEAALRSAIIDLGRRRRWSTARCDAVTEALLAGRDHDAVLRPPMEAGPRPFAACATACPDRTCRFREIVAPVAERVTSGGDGVVLRMLGDENERRRRLARRVRDVVPPEFADGSDVVVQVTKCLAVQVFDRDFDEPTVTAIVRRIGADS